MKVLDRLPKFHHEELIVGPHTLDDAGVYCLDEKTGLVQTLDFFPPVVDDPTWFGRIAAANALSDVYAMGGRAITAMNIVGFPKELDIEILGEILAGGAEKIEESGAALCGGHSVQDTEVKYGLSVTGLVDPARLVSNAGAEVGDVLVLTKPLGMGTISTAMKKERVGEDAVERACAQMATLNRGASEAMLEIGVHAATDVTGFGLLGHGRGMAEASDVMLEFEAAALPLFEGSLELAEEGLLSGGAARTRLFLGETAESAETIPFPLQQLAFDAETSGGLLIACPADRAEALLEALRRYETPCAVVVGAVVARDGDVRVRLR